MSTLTQLVRGILCVLAVPVVLVCTGVFCLGSLTLLSLFSTSAVRCEPLVPTGKAVVKGRMTAQMSGDFVVVLIGSAFSSWRSVPRAISIALSMRHMLKELQDEPHAGFLGATSWLGNPTVSIQYWRSLEDLHRYARSPKRKHVGAWGMFNRYLRQAAAGQHSDSQVGIYHEAYQVRAGRYETVYSNMPATGLGRVAQLVPIQDQRSTKSSKQRAAVHQREASAAADPGAGTAHRTPG